MFRHQRLDRLISSLLLSSLLLISIAEESSAAPVATDQTEQVPCDSQDNLQCSNNGKCTVLVRKASSSTSGTANRLTRLEAARCECPAGFTGDKCETKSDSNDKSEEKPKSGSKFGDWATAAFTYGGALIGLLIVVFVGSVLYIGYVNKRTSQRGISQRSTVNSATARSSTGTASQSQKMSQQMTRQKTMSGP